jgi:hypothetical protein
MFLIGPENIAVSLRQWRKASSTRRVAGPLAIPAAIRFGLIRTFSITWRIEGIFSLTAPVRRCYLAFSHLSGWAVVLRVRRACSRPSVPGGEVMQKKAMPKRDAFASQSTFDGLTR